MTLADRHLARATADMLTDLAAIVRAEETEHLIEIGALRRTP